MESNFSIEYWDVERIVPYSNNPRNINKTAIEKVATSIKEFGWRQPIVVDPDGIIIVGHVRFGAAQLLNLKQVPVHIVDGLSNAQIKAYRIADNRTGEETSFDFDLLKVEMADLETAKFDFNMTGFDVPEISDFMVGPMFSPATEAEQGQLDQKTPIKCPECGHEFTT